MRGNVLTLQVFTLLRELTATDSIKRELTAIALRVWPMRNGIGNSNFFSSPEPKAQGELL